MVIHDIFVTAGQTQTIATGDKGDNPHVDAGGTLNVFGEVVYGYVYGTQLVESGGYAHDNNVAGGVQQVLAGGRSFNTTVQGHFGGANGFEYVYSGGLSDYVGVNSGGVQIVYAGGKSTRAVVAEGGAEYILGEADKMSVHVGGITFVNSGGVANATKLDHGVQNVNAHGVANATSVLSGGVENVNLGGVSLGASVYGGGVENVYGRANQTLLVGGAEYVFSGGVSNHANISGGSETLYANGVANGAVIGNGGSEIVEAGGLSKHAIVNGGGVEDINLGGYANGATVQAGGVENVYGLAAHTLLNGGVEYVYAGGVSNFTRISDGFESIYAGGLANRSVVASGYEFVNDGATSNSARIGARGVEYVFSGGASLGAVINSGGVEQVFGTATATRVNSGGTAYVHSGGATKGAVIAGGWLDVQGGGVVGGDVDFVHGQGGLLTLENSAGFLGRLVGFEAGDAVDLRDIGYSAADTLGFRQTTAMGGVLTVGDGAHSASIALLGTYTDTSFATTSDGNGGLFVFMPSSGHAQSLGQAASLAINHA